MTDDTFATPSELAAWLELAHLQDMVRTQAQTISALQHTIASLRFLVTAHQSATGKTETVA